jgi:hypothetical protein
MLPLTSSAALLGYLKHENTQPLLATRYSGATRKNESIHSLLYLSRELWIDHFWMKQRTGSGCGV